MKVSVVIPVFNSKHLVEAVESAFSQTYSKIEVIVVDDGSNDDIRELLKNYDILYFRQENKGPAAARNFGMTMATGDYIAFLDADDVWLPQKIEKQVELLISNPDLGFVYCDNNFITESNTIIKDYSRKIELHRGDVLLKMYEKFMLITSALMMKTSCLAQIGYFREDLYIGEDIEYFLRLSKEYKADAVSAKLLNRRVWSGGISRKDYTFNGKIILDIHKKFLSLNPDFYSLHKDAVDNRLAELHYNFAYKYWGNGKLLPAVLQFIQSYKYKIKTLIRITLSNINLFPLFRILNQRIVMEIIK